MGLFFCRTPEDDALGSYEVFASEGLHDVKEHVKHVLEELPAHLTGQTKVAFTAYIAKEIASRAMIRGSDNRRILTKLPAIMTDSKASAEVQTLVNTLAELAKLLYLTDSDRTPKTVLRLYNVAFLHAMTCVDVLNPSSALSRSNVRNVFSQT